MEPIDFGFLVVVVMMVVSVVVLAIVVVMVEEAKGKVNKSKMAEHSF